MRHSLQSLVALAAGLAVMLPLPGCGGGSHGSGDGGDSGRGAGQISLTVKWPPPSRLIPAASNSIKAVLTRGAATLGTQTLVRPAEAPWTTTATFNNLAAGPVTLTASAFPSNDATGIAQASGSAPASIVAGQTVNVVVTLGSTITSLGITPANPTVRVGGTAQLTATAKDAQGNVVLVQSGSLQWTSTVAANATVNGTGLVTGVKAGTSVITVKDSESGITSPAATLTVSAAGPSFAIHAGDTSNVQQGKNTSFDFTVQSLNGFAGTVTLSSADLPPGVDATYSKQSVTLAANGTADVTVDYQTAASTPAGTYHPAIVGTSGAITNRDTETLTVTLPPGRSFLPLDVAVGPDNKIYFTDEKAHQLVRMDDMNGTNLATFGSQGSGVNQFFAPWRVTFDAQGRIYVADFGNDRIVRFDDMTGKNWATFGTHGTGAKQFFGPRGLAIDKNGRFYVADLNNNRVARFDDFSGANWTTFGTAGSGPGQFNSPRQVFVDNALRIYVTDSNNNRVVRMDDMSGANFTALGTAGTGVGQFLAPHGIFVTPNGTIFVTNEAGNSSGGPRLDRFTDMSGANWTMLGTSGSGVGQFAVPRGIFVDSGNRIYVADWDNNRIDRFDDMTGAGWVTFQ